MKSLGLGLIHLSLLAMLSSCGKDNESGKKSSWQYGNPYTTGHAPFTNINSQYMYSGMSVNQVMAETPCRSGFSGMTYPGMPSSYGGQRVPIQVPLVNFPTVIAPGEVYVGVTTFGDVAVVAGQAPGQPPLFEGYMCPRSFSPSGQGQLLGIKIGAYSNCLFKPLTAATVVFPGGGTAEFRFMDGGTSVPAQPGTPPDRVTQFGLMKFSFCR